MIRATFPAALQAAGAEPGRRIIAGTAVPWNVEGRVASGDVVIFHPGSLDDQARPIALRDHDRGRIIGRVADARDTGALLRATVRAAPTREGDDALVLAGDPDGPLLQFSVGAEPTRFNYDDRGRMHVYAADWLELSLLSFGAYADAVVDTVAASSPTPEVSAMPDELLTDEPPEVDEPDDDAEPNPDIEPDEPSPPETAQAPALTAAARPVPLAAGRRGGPRTPTLRQIAHLLTAGRGGDSNARRQLAAALALQPSVHAALEDVTLTGDPNIAVLHRPAYQAELVDIISWGSPLVDALRQGDLQRGDYPTLTFNQWVTTPEFAEQTDEKTEINTGPIEPEPVTVTVHTFATGNDVSQQVLDFGRPSFIEDYIRMAGMKYAHFINGFATTELLAAANQVTPTGTSFIEIVGELVASLSPATAPPGGYFLAIAQDVAASLIAVPRDEGPAFWDGHVNFGRFLTEVTNDAALTVFANPDQPAGSYLLGHREGATWYDVPGTPFNLRAVNVGLLGLDIGVFGYGALGVQYPGAFAAVVPEEPEPPEE